MLRLLLENVSDIRIRENLQKIFEYIRDRAILRGEFKFFELTFTQAETNKKIPHGFGFTPLDVIQTSKTGAGSITWNYASFDAVNLDITTTGACVVRAFVGRYGETEA